MTTIEYGGGSTLEQRQAFCAPKDGTQIPGYAGHVHQFDFRCGHTFGEETHRLAQTYEFRHPVSETTESVDRPPLKNELPDPTGDNKFTKNMVPGYTGDVPRRLFQFGRTYKNDCDVGIDQHITNCNYTREKEGYLRQMVKTFPKQQVLNFDPAVRDHLNTYRDTHPLPPILAEAKRGSLEPPMCSYKGYVPRVIPTDTSLGLCYRDAARRSLARFGYETCLHYGILDLPVNIDSCPSSVPRLDNPVSKRIYLNDGMIPKYTGWVPEKKYVFGMTYGDSTRAVEVCSHKKDSYGDHMRTKGPTTTIVVS